ncbi:hypothetical protein ACO2I3_12455 [Leptospira interrogans]
MQQPPSHPGEQPVFLTMMWHVQQQLGALQEGQRNALVAIERSRVENHQRHDRLEERLWHVERSALVPVPAAPVSPTTGSRTGPSRTEHLLTAMQHLITILKLLLPLAFLAALVAGKITHPEAFPIIRQALGLQ